MNLRVAGYGLTVVGIFVGMCCLGYLAAAIVMERMLNGR